MSQPCRLIEISGRPFERGQSYGRQAASEIKKGIAHYGGQLKKLDLDEAAFGRLVAAILPKIESFEPSYIEEMRGIADGSGVDFNHIVMINARTEILKLAASSKLFDTVMNDPDPDGCTAVVVCPEAAAEGRLIHAHNWDWKLESAEASVVMRIRREDGPDILAFAEAGALGRFGFNAKGIGITGNYLECDRDYAKIGVPLALIRRKVLDQEHFALALRSAYCTPKSGSNNIVVSHSGGGMVFNFECAPDETFEVEPKDGLLVHANHWQSAVARVKLRETGVKDTPDSLYRDRRARALLTGKKGGLSAADVKDALLDDWESPWSICRPPRPNLSSNLSATVISLVMQPALGLMEIAVLPALDPTFTPYTLEMEQAACG